MQLNITGKNFELTDALRSHTTEKFKSLEKRNSHITIINTVLHIEHLDQIAEATIHASGTEIHATAKSEDMYRSVDMLVEKLVAQLTKLKEKATEQHR